MLRSVGIDLSAEPKGTAIASVQWLNGFAVVESILLGCRDDIVLHWMHHPDGSVGIDCPFGWPVKFVELLCGHANRSFDVPAEFPVGWRREYVLRATDRWIHDELGLVPLSVAADRIGHTAIRLAALMRQLGEHVHSSLDGSGAIAEVYPAAALKKWGLPFRGYKGVAGVVVRNSLVDELMRMAPWLNLGDYERTIRESDDALDSVVCALAARAVKLGLTYPPEDRDAALLEGWIHVPTRPLASLM